MNDGRPDRRPGLGRPSMDWVPARPVQNQKKKTSSPFRSDSLPLGAFSEEPDPDGLWDWDMTHGIGEPSQVGGKAWAPLQEPEVSEQPSTPPKKRGHSRQTRLLDLKKKKEKRQLTKVLLRTLWDLETQARERENPPAAFELRTMRGATGNLLSVLEEVMGRVRVMTNKLPPPGHPSSLVHSFLSPGDVREGLALSTTMGVHSFLSPGDVREGLALSTTMGVLYVCMDDWVVRQSNRAMELLCPFGIVRGYAGFELPCFVHPDDHFQLQVLRQQLQSFTPGEAPELRLNLRMMRACMDRGTLVVAWERLTLDVVHVGADREHGGALHAMLTCALEPSCTEPLLFDEADREFFQATSHAVSGTMVIDPGPRTGSVETVLRAVADEQEGAEEEGVGGSPASEFLFAVSRAVGRTLGLPQLLAFVKQRALLTATSLFRPHVLLGIAPDGRPWIQKSAALCAFGYMSPYHTYLSASLSGCPGLYLPRMGCKTCFMGVLKPEPTEVVFGAGGGRTIGSLTFCFSPNLATGGGRAFLVSSNRFSVGSGGKGGESTWLTLYDRKGPGGLPRRVDMCATRVAGPDAYLVEQFLRFDGLERAGIPFPELGKLFPSWGSKQNVYPSPKHEPNSDAAWGQD